MCECETKTSSEPTTCDEVPDRAEVTVRGRCAVIIGGVEVTVEGNPARLYIGPEDDGLDGLRQSPIFGVFVPPKKGVCS